MRGISIRHPWAWSVMHAGKRIDNRDWYCEYRGEVLIHASKLRQTKRTVPSKFMAEWSAMQNILRKVGADKALLAGVSYTSLVAQSGGIIGRAQIVDCILPGGCKVGAGLHPMADDPWYTGGFGIVLEQVQEVPFFAYKGSLGLWKVNRDAVMAFSVPELGRHPNGKGDRS